MKPIKLKKKEKKNEESNDEKDKHYAEAFLEGMPFLDGFFKELGKTDVFKERFKEVNEKIEENLKKGGKKEYVIESRLSVRPIISNAKEGTTNVGIGEDYFYEQKHDKLALLVKVPKEEVALSIQGKELIVTADNFEKRIELPDYFKRFQKKEYKNGALLVELIK